MSRPLVVSDCDEVLLRMVAHFRDWLAESQDVTFALEGNNFATAMRWSETGEPLAEKDIWRMLGGFFDTEMHRQDPIAGAVQAIHTLQERADVVILTNLNDERRDTRTQQLLNHGIEAKVFTNQGPKGPALGAIIEDYAPSRTFFIDDLAQHHQSAAETLNGVTSLHLCGEPSIAAHIPCAHKAGHAAARIDSWDAALPWLLSEMESEAA